MSLRASHLTFQPRAVSGEHRGQSMRRRNRGASATSVKVGLPTSRSEQVHTAQVALPTIVAIPHARTSNSTASTAVRNTPQDRRVSSLISVARSLTHTRRVTVALVDDRFPIVPRKRIAKSRVLSSIVRILPRVTPKRTSSQPAFTVTELRTTGSVMTRCWC
jgi:hypothetical protein